MSDSTNQETGGKKVFTIADLDKVLTDLIQTVSPYPSLKKELPFLVSVQQCVKTVKETDTDKDGYLVYEMARSPYWQHAFFRFILSQRQDYHFGTCSLPATEEYPEKSVKKQERDNLFDKQRQLLFQIASSSIYPTKARNVYEYARSCPDFVFVDEITLYYGGAGRTCVDTHMTRLLYSKAEAISFAKKYLVEKAPKINYREIFKALIEFMEDYTPIKSFLARYDIDVLFPHEDIWIGANEFKGILEKEVMLRDDFKKIFRSFSGENEWLRPYLRITNQYEEIGAFYNRLLFNFETGCAWQIE